MDDFESDYQILQSHLNDYKGKKASVLTKMLFYELKNRLYLFYGRIRPIFDDESFLEEKLEYQHFKYVQSVIPHEKIDIWIRNLIYPIEEPEEENYFISGNQKFFFSGQINFKRESYDPRWLRVMKFHPRCRTIFTMRYPSQSLSRRPDLHTTNPKLPYYPTIKELILHKFGFSTDSYSPSNNLHFALVPISGYISKISSENDFLVINVKNKEGFPLTLKIYGETKTKQCETINFTTTKTDTFTLSSKFSKINVTLVNQDGILLDTREFFKKYKFKVEEIEDLIYQGEDETVDFKLWNPDIKGEGKTKRRKKFARLLTAFANNKGGKILFGVSDEAEIIGIEKGYLDEIEKLLTNIGEEKTRPRVKVEKNFVEINNRLIGIFKVKKSERIVQNVYDKHYYIRRGSTNRIMRPEEIEQVISRIF